MQKEAVAYTGAFQPIAQMIRMTGGLTLSQLSEVSGLEPTTIQNWVKRGWVEPPKERRYAEESTARVLVISMLRGAMQLSEIVELLAYVNGKVDDRSDDAVPDGMLYGILSAIADKVNHSSVYSRDMLEETISELLGDYVEPFPGGYQKLRNTLTVMALACTASALKAQAETVLGSLLGEKKTNK